MHHFYLDIELSGYYFIFIEIMINPLTTQSHLYACVPEANLEIMQLSMKGKNLYI
jgi:hypothetical protein